MTACLKTILTVSISLSIHLLHAQQFLPDSAAARIASDETIRGYHEFEGSQSRIYNGSEQIGYFALVGHPYFEDENKQMGVMVYEGVKYRDVPMLYDLIKDQLIISDSSGNLIGLAGERISAFFLFGHQFIQTPHGFCDLLYSGPVTILAKRKKRIDETIENIKVVRTVYEEVHYFALENGVYHPFSNLRSLLNLMKDKKKEINKDLRSKGIHYKKTPEEAIIAAAAYYNTHLSPGSIPHLSTN
jgi:hypothetical protein